MIHSTMSAEQQKMPLILVGNKSDTDEISVLIDSVLSIMNDFPEVGRERQYKCETDVAPRPYCDDSIFVTLGKK